MVCVCGGGGVRVQARERVAAAQGPCACLVWPGRMRPPLAVVTSLAHPRGDCPSAACSSGPADGVYLHPFSLGSPLAVEDFCTLLVDVRGRRVSVAVNGFPVPGSSLALLPGVTKVVPVVELYQHGDPRMTIIPLPFLAE